MNLAFSTADDRTLCECQKTAERTLGMSAADQLRQRLADLRAADSVLEVPAGNPRECEVDGTSYFVFDLADGYRLLLRPQHKKVPMSPAGVVWAEVTRVAFHKIDKPEVCNG